MCFITIYFGGYNKTTQHECLIKLSPYVSRLSNLSNIFRIARIPSQPAETDSDGDSDELYSHLWIRQIHRFGTSYHKRLMSQFQIVMEYVHVTSRNVEACDVSCQVVPGDKECLDGWLSVNNSLYVRYTLTVIGWLSIGPLPRRVLEGSKWCSA